MPVKISLPDGRQGVYGPLLDARRCLRPQRLRNLAINASILLAVCLGYVMLDVHGFVNTTNSTNFFIARKGEVWTSTGDYCMNGITRRKVIERGLYEKLIARRISTREAAQ